MTDEEKKAVENITAWVEFEESAGENLKTFRTALNLIEKQEKEIKILKEQKEYVINEYGRTNEGKDKMINEMAKYIVDIDITEIMCPKCKYRNTECTMQECVESIIEYFKKKVEEN
jgi:dihydroorotate dehydrogenase